MDASKQVTCSKCGRKVDDGLAFCPYCGNKILNDQKQALTEQPSVTPKNESQMWGVWVTIGWVLFALSFFPVLSIFQIAVFAIGLVVQKYYKHTGAGMALWIAALVLFGISFMIGFGGSYYG